MDILLSEINQVEISDIYQCPTDITGNLDIDKTDFWPHVKIAINEGKHYLQFVNNYYIIKSDSVVKGLTKIGNIN